jgi:hypothetical protein
MAYGLSRHDAIDRCRVPEGCNVDTYCCENVKSKLLYFSIDNGRYLYKKGLNS